ncbi:MAG: uridylate kinase, partial [Methanomicrobiales archaeon]|nr:uridylate kinase [Methanomicrobiales archaeon]
MKRGRFDVESKLQGESLVRRGLLERYEGRPQIRLMPSLNVVKIGGHGIIDYGGDVVLPLLEEIGELSRQNQILVVTGGGVRVRHILDVGLDLGMPTGILAELAGKISEQNAIMVSTLLSRWRGMRIHTGDLLELPMLMSIGVLPVTHGTPPYGLYEQPAEIGAIPPNRTDTGAFLAAEVLGAKNLILVKNVDGLYTDNPFINPDAELIPDITAAELLDMNLEDMVLETRVVELLRYAKNVHEVKIVNGHEPGNIRKVLDGGKPGT